MRNKVTILVIAVMMLAVSVAFAGVLSGDNNTNTNLNTNANTNLNANTNVNTNAQGQMQGQLQGQMQGQGQKQTAVGKVNTDVNVSGDVNKVYANSWPSISGAEGVSSGTASSLFGSLGMSSTEQYKKLMPQIQVISNLIKDGTISKEAGQDQIDTLVKRMLRANKTQRFLGIFWETDSKSLINLLGLLSWDSIWDEGQNPFQSKRDMIK